LGTVDLTMNYPDFIIIGAAKSGTTMLTSWLRDREDVFVPEFDELNFWAYDEHSPGKLRWGNSPERDWPVTSANKYAEMFDNAPKNCATGECSVMYLESAFAAERIYSANPDTRLIVLLRDPVQRAISGYWMAHRNGWTNDTLGTAFSPENDRVKVGEYDTLLKPYLKLFPRNRLLVLDYSRLKTEPEKVQKEVCDHLSLDSTIVSSFRTVNQGGAPRWQRLYDLSRNKTLIKLGRNFQYSPIHKAVRSLRSKTLVQNKDIPMEEINQLRDHYRPHVENLESLLKMPFPTWLE